MRGMGKPALAFVLCSIVIAMLSCAHAGASTLAQLTHKRARPSAVAAVTRSMDRRFARLNQGNEVLTKLTLYIQASFVGQNQTVHPVAAADVTPLSAADFGQILVIDNTVTAGPEPDSQVVARYQGLFSFTDLSEPASTMNFNVIFTDGEYAGSTFTILGRQPVAEEVRVMHVAGGTGAFLLARGAVVESTYSTDPILNTGTYLIVVYLIAPFVGLPISSVFSA